LSSQLPLVSVITPSYNQGRFIEETIQSVLNQDYPNLEYIVVDGGSTDATLDILKAYGERIRWVSEPDNGQSEAVNKGFRMSKGEILGWLNSDDTYSPDAIRSAVQFLTGHPDVAMVYGDGYEVDAEGKRIRKFPVPEKFDLDRLMHRWNYIQQPAVFMRRDPLFEVNLLDPSLHWAMDYDLWIRIGRKYRVAYLPVPFANLRYYTSTKTSSGGLPRLREIIKIIRKHGGRRYPPGIFLYSLWILENLLRNHSPGLNRFLFKVSFGRLRYWIRRTILGSHETGRVE
jgi:glycosyltransferase involved in cell wall biosynthesis